MPATRNAAERWLCAIVLLLTLALCLLRFAYLRADFPNYSPWMLDQAKFTDEGWWANAAVRHFLIGHWRIPGDYNPAAAVPLWPVLLTLLFQFTGANIVAVRALSVTFSLATVVLVYLLTRRYGGTETAAALAALLLAASSFAFAFSRLATLDTVVNFEWALLMWVASYATPKRIWPLVTLGVLIPVMLLTKTTALALLPSVLWLLWMAARKSFRAILAVIAMAGAWCGIYLAVVLRSRYAEDYRYFFHINALVGVEWERTASLLLQLFRHGMWIDRILYPVALAILLLSVVWLRQLWRNPLFAAAWIAFAGEAIYIFRRQDDYAPRYFLAMLIPLIFVVVLTLHELKSRKHSLAYLLAGTLAVALILDIAQVLSFLKHRQYQFYAAAKSIQAIVSRNPKAHRLLLGSSADQLSLMVGIPAVNDGYGSQDLDKKTAFYQPGWYLGWNELDQDILSYLSAFRLDQVASFPVFDHDQRDRLILYRMVPLKEAPK